MPTDMYNDAVCTSDFFYPLFSINTGDNEELTKTVQRKETELKILHGKFLSRLHVSLCRNLSCVCTNIKRGHEDLFSRPKSFTRIQSYMTASFLVNPFNIEMTTGNFVN